MNPFGSLPFRLRSGLWLVASLLLLGTACSDNVEITHRYTFMRPVYTPTAEIRNSFAVEAPRTLTGTGKIYYRAPYVFINQPGEGVHIINNTNPENPVNERFVNIPGNFDMAVLGNTMYADSYVDLLAIDISNVNNVRVVKRLERAFPAYNSWGFYWDEEAGIITRWEEDERVEVFEDELTAMNAPGLFRFRGGIARNDAVFSRNASLASFSAEGSSVSSDGAGVGGSMARFAIADERLYTIDDYNLRVFSLENAESPVAGDTVPVGFAIETIFPFKDKLFIGSRSGMFIYDQSNPDRPQLISEFQHATSCDPVVANDSMAYVTLRSGNACEGFINQLDVIDIRDVTRPKLVKTYPMENPHGLGISGTTLFICEGDFGLKVLDATNSRDITGLTHFKDVHAYDVTPLGEILMMVGDDGLYQYDYSDPAQVRQLSKLDIVRPQPVSR
ncbi:MAG: hypothetical protein WA960_01550 [Tunicatimonas sp.]